MSAIVVGGETFTAKKALGERVRAILYRQPEGHSLDDADLFFMCALLARHPDAEEKVGAGVAMMNTRPTTYGNRCFWITRIDGSETDFSFLSCINGRKPIDDFRAACRSAVRPQVVAARQRAFAAAPSIACPITGEIVTSATCHIDHAPPHTFDKIVADFLEASAVDPAKVKVTGGDGQVGCHFLDGDMRARFAEFHAERASLRAVSRTANLSHLRRARP